MTFKNCINMRPWRTFFRYWNWELRPFLWWKKHPQTVYQPHHHRSYLVGGSTHLKNISPIGSFLQVGVERNHIWNHHLSPKICVEPSGKITTDFLERKIQGGMEAAGPRDQASSVRRSKWHVYGVSAWQLFGRDVLKNCHVRVPNFPVVKGSVAIATPKMWGLANRPW